MISVKLTKLRGQHLLRDERVLADIVAAAELTRNDTVLEVGPGTGTLTVELAKRAGHVVAVELDRRFEAELRRTLVGRDNIELIWGDVLRIPLLNPPPFKGGGKGGGFKIVSNLPYQITSPFLWKFLTDDGPELLVLMIQKEVAERIAAKPPRMSLLAVMVQTFGTVEIVRPVSRSAFYPPPRVDSAVIRIRRVPVDFDRDRVIKLAKAGFSSPRRKLSNNLKGFKLTSIPDARAENLSIADWKRLAL